MALPDVVRDGASAQAFEPIVVRRVPGFRRFRGSAGSAPSSAAMNLRTFAGRRAVADVERGDVVAAEVGRHAGRKLFREELNVAVHPGCEAVVDVARLRFEQVIGLDRSRPRPQVLEVRLEPRPPLEPRELTARGDQSERRPCAVVLRHDPRERVATRAQVLGPDVRHAMRRPNDLDLPPEVGSGHGRSNGSAEDERDAEREGCGQRDARHDRSSLAPRQTARKRSI